jgi:predicted nucleic acid-binding protein
MDLVLDANVLFAAFMKDSTTRNILLTKTPTPLKLYVPPFLLDEVYKYKGLLAKKPCCQKARYLTLFCG